MENEVAGGPAFKAIDDEMIRRKVVRHIQALANLIK